MNNLMFYGVSDRVGKIAERSKENMKMKSQPVIFALMAAVALPLATKASDHDRDHGRGGGQARWESRGARENHVWTSHEPRPHYSVSHRPPAFRHEWIPARPGYGYVWLPGCWRWRSDFGDWLWISGYWALPPRAGVIYVEPRYQVVGTQCTVVEGGWCDEGYARSDGTATGAVLGGVVGGIIGHQSHNTGVGALAGVLIGSLLGHEVDQDRARQDAEVARERQARLESEKARADANAALEKDKLIAQGRTVSEAELDAARDRARVAKEKLAAAKATREAQERQAREEQQVALGRAAALEKANAEAAAAEAELQTLQPEGGAK